MATLRQRTHLDYQKKGALSTHEWNNTSGVRALETAVRGLSTPGPPRAPHYSSSCDNQTVRSCPRGQSPALYTLEVNNYAGKSWFQKVGERGGVLFFKPSASNCEGHKQQSVELTTDVCIVVTTP